ARCQHSKPNASTGDAYVHHPGSMDGTGKFYLGREIAQIMSSSGAMWLERDEREKEENTREAIRSMKLSPESVVADIGAGTGYYTFQVASVTSQGKVYAIDVQEEMLRMLRERKEKLNDKVVEVVKGSSKSVNLPDNSVDLAFMVDVYHELEFPKEMLRSIYAALKKDGRLLLIEYRGEDPSIPIKPLHKTTVVQLNKELKANGFELQERGDFLPIQHFLIYRKQ
ncbi:MAG TPA: class I SAM-dependent methyltransferase, partial [Flavitalea sp.]|nr:class I SAM-dependent methyltransferase [Flavitalea sp.]